MLIRWSILSCPWLHVQSSTCADVSGVATLRRSPDGPPVGFGDPSTLQEESSDSRRASTPGYATPSGFLNLLTLYSALDPSGLVSCRWRPWVFTFSGFPCAVASVPFRRPFSSVSFQPPDQGRVRRDFEDLRTRGVRCAEPVLPGLQRPIRSWLSPLRGLHLVGLGCERDLTASFLGLRHDARWPKPPIVMPALQSFREPARQVFLFRERPSLPGVFDPCPMHRKRASGLGPRPATLRSANRRTDSALGSATAQHEKSLWKSFFLQQSRDRRVS